MKFLCIYTENKRNETLHLLRIRSTLNKAVCIHRLGVSTLILNLSKEGAQVNSFGQTS